MSSRDIIALPAYTFRLRLAQIILAILILILNIVSTAVLGGYGAFSYGIFTPIATCIIVIYWYLANYTRPQNYNRWVILILECFAVVWWLSAWSVEASWASVLGYIDTFDNSYGLDNGNSIRVAHALAAVAAVLGAAEFILFVITLVTFSIALHNARKSERQNNHQIPFSNTNQGHPNQQINNGSISKSNGVHSDGGVEVAP